MRKRILAENALTFTLKISLIIGGMLLWVWMCEASRSVYVTRTLITDARQ